MLFVAFFSQLPAKAQAFGLVYRVVSPLVSPLPPQLSQLVLPPQLSQLLHVSEYADVDTIYSQKNAYNIQWDCKHAYRILLYRLLSSASVLSFSVGFSGSFCRSSNSFSLSPFSRSCQRRPKRLVGRGLSHLRHPSNARRRTRVSRPRHPFAHA